MSGWRLFLRGREELLLGGVGAEAEPRSLCSVSPRRYYINLCQRVYKGPLDCSDRASVCRKSESGDVQVLGLVHTQKLDIEGEARALGA